MNATHKKSVSRQHQAGSVSNVVHLYQVRPELVLEHLKRKTGLDFDSIPQSLVNVDCDIEDEPGLTEPPLLTEVVEGSV